MELARESYFEYRHSRLWTSSSHIDIYEKMSEGKLLDRESKRGGDDAVHREVGVCN